jgi:hypothetical protein
VAASHLNCQGRCATLSPAIASNAARPAATTYPSSPAAERGFCNHCGSSLFWRHDDDKGATSVMSGTLDGATGIKTAKHIFTADKGDYYDIADFLPQEEH